MTDLKAAMTAGVFVEFHDPEGNTVGQAVFADWEGRPVPAVGDILRCPVKSTTTGRQEKLVGKVTNRHFEVQHDNGQACVWVRLDLTVQPHRRVRLADFSAN